MKKTLAVLLLTVVFAACATMGGGKNIEMLGKKQVFNMTTNEVTAFYQQSNNEILTNLVYNYGGSLYDPLTTTFTSMNRELEAMSKAEMTKEGYYEKLKSVVSRYRTKIKSIVKESTNI